MIIHFRKYLWLFLLIISIALITFQPMSKGNTAESLLYLWKNPQVYADNQDNLFSSFDGTPMKNPNYLSLPLYSQPKEEPMDQDFVAIIETVEAYFDGSKQGSRSLLEQAFHPAAMLKTVSPSEEYSQMGLEEFLNFVQQRGMSNHTTEIISLEQAGNIAMVKVVLNFESYSFLDFLSLVKVKDGWKIVDKLYTKY